MSARTALSFSRDLEFATEAELAKRMGCSRRMWPLAAIRELIDNALDACEERGIAPVITIRVDARTILIADNGPGLAPDLVERLCVRSERTSTREAYAAPDRGSMGNALSVIMALPLGYGLDEAETMIVSQGVAHSIRLRVNRLAQRIDLERTTRQHAATDGTTVILVWPEDDSLIQRAVRLPKDLDGDDLKDLIDRFAWLNPHAEFRFGDMTWEATATVTKWTPGMPVPPHWYTPERFAHRVLLELRGEPGVTVAQFLGSFRGLSDRSRRSAVAAEVGLSYQPLAALLDASGVALDQERARRLLDAMCAASRPPKPAALGAIGKNSFADWAAAVAANHGSDQPELLAYSTIDGVVQGEIPWRWELGFAHIPDADEASILIGQNFSPALHEQAMLSAALPYSIRHLDDYDPIVLFLHRVTPARQTTDYGKSGLAIGRDEAHAIHEALERLAAPWIKRRETARRKAEQEEKKREKPPPGTKPMRFKHAAFAAMADAYDEASSNGAFPVLSQQVFYQARPKILELMKRDALKPEWRSHFCYTLLPQFMQTNPKLTAGWRILYKPRGELVEPHTRHKVGLGTAEVANYRAIWTNGLALGDTDFDMPEWEVETHGPHHRYGAVVAVEKGGIADVLRQTGVHNRNDVAIIGNEGQSVEAELVLADALGGIDIPIFLLADFDRQGFTIAENLRIGTWRHRYRNRVQVVHVGLKLEQIEAIGGLEDEPIGENTLKHVGDDRLRECCATEEEIALLRTRRVELNALTTEQLVALVEGALAEHGIGKVIPDAEDLQAAWRSAKAHAEIAKAVEEANKRAERWQNEPVPEGLLDRVRDLLEWHPTISWDTALREIAGGQP